jgi:oxygen-independent coproporphyrinogen-3 oxidase
LALYVHWPFCLSKCPYCDFNSHVRASWDDLAWAEALLADLRHEAALLGRRPLASIFFGGGTPSLMPPATAGALIDEAARLFDPAQDLEITIEANPSSVEAVRFAGFRAAGVNRVSLGLQALDDAALRFLGRAHGVGEGLAALDLAQRTFPRVSFDLITARPGQSVAEWASELSRALAFGTEHLSLYQLTIEPGTRFQTLHARGEIALPDEDIATELWDVTQALTGAAGLPAYETSNHARPGAESRHNLAYWTYGDYAGIGPGAHGRRAGTATVRHKKPENWLAAVGERGHGINEETALEPVARAEEALLVGLRLTDGIDKARFAERTGLELAAAVRLGAVAELSALGLLVDTPDRLALTVQGRPLLNAVLAKITA